MDSQIIKHWCKERRFYANMSKIFLITGLLAWTSLFFFPSTVLYTIEFALIGLSYIIASFWAGTEAKTIERALERRGEGK